MTHTEGGNTPSAIPILTFAHSPSQENLLPDSSKASTPGGIISPKSIDGFLDDEEDSPTELHEPAAGFSSCSINLLKTILGAGMLAMPSAYASLGYVPATLMVLMAASFAAFGLHLFIVSSQYVGRNVTISKLANLTYPQLTILFDAAITIKCFGVAISYLIVIGDMVPSIVQGLGYQHPILINRQFWLLISAILLTPLAFLKRMDSLKYTSFMGLLSVLYLVGVSIWNFLKPEAIRPPPNAGMEAFETFSFASLKSFSVFVFSFTCHQNVYASNCTTNMTIDFSHPERGHRYYSKVL